MKKALLIIDYVNDFVADDGKLTCGKTAQNLEFNILSKIKEYVVNNDIIVSACDHHKENDMYNVENKLFVPHCLENTKGAKLFNEVSMMFESVSDNQKIEIHKTRYSAFSGTNLDYMLRLRDVKEVCLVGVCTDICVLHTAIDAYNLGYEITIYENCVASFNSKNHEFALNHFINVLGANVIKK